MSVIDYISLILGVLVAYGLGSIPSAVWIGKSFYGVDVREKGSKNMGTTNTIRVLGLLPGLFVLGLDVFKGWLAIYMGNIFGSFYLNYWDVDMGDLYLNNYKLCLGLVAVIGHALPCFVNFKGGKGVAIMLGVVIGLFHNILPLIIGTFVVVFVIWKYISLASIVTAVAFPVFYATCSIWLQYQVNWILFSFACLVPLFIIFTHRKNIKRLIKGEEPQFKFKKTIDE
ncbi:MAG: glycerol-3-phosphate 1-O-acyltransferase PlsY [Bacteroidales bacterium]|jgi:glycerol-3-phosphate acyltransferase PlsY|nr:glycerol-3-phosphate 1-O-acyltransferase PlsY [Bacteroidales bacterium]